MTPKAQRQASQAAAHQTSIANKQYIEGSITASSIHKQYRPTIQQNHTSLSMMKRPRSATPSSVKTLYFLLISLFKSETRGYFSSPTPPSFLSAAESGNIGLQALSRYKLNQVRPDISTADGGRASG